MNPRAMAIIEEFMLRDKVALVASDGGMFTPYIAEVLAEAGARVCVLSRTQPSVDEAVSVVSKHGVDGIGGTCDLSDEEAVGSAIRELLARRGRVDILVNSFLSEFAKPFEDVTATEFDAVQERNVKPVFLMCREVGKQMMEQGGGRIVNMISGLAERGLSNSAAYSASQGAVLQLTRSLALEWGKRNIRVNAIGTGWFSDADLPPEEAQKELLVRYTPLRRRGHPRDIAPLLVYLASDACDYTTGHPVYVDGGLMAHP